MIGLMNSSAADADVPDGVATAVPRYLLPAPLSALLATLLATLLAALLWSAGSAAFAADLVLTIATGSPGRAYHSVGERLRAVGSERGMEVLVITTDGSLENLTRLADPTDPVDVALTQADALHRFMGENPGFGASVKIMESIGPECVFAIAPVDGAIDDFEGWQRAVAPKVALPAPESGVALTHAIMAGVIPELADDEPVYLDAAAAIDALHAEGDGSADLAFSVHRAKFRGPELRAALARPDRYRIIPIADKRLKLQFADGSTAYEQITLPLVRGSAAGDISIDTLCTKGLLVSAPAKLGEAAQAALQQIVDYDWMQVYPESP
jgi:hypothetical protein